MKKSFLIVILFLGLLGLNPLKAQIYLPGVTETLFEAINQEVKSDINEDLFVSSVLNVDSSLGFRLGLRYPEIGIIEDSNNLLTGSYIFLASRVDYSNSDSIGGIIGIYKNNQIIWYSDNLIKENLALIGDYVWSVKDINGDGNVDIMTTWTSRNSYNIWSDGSTSKLMYLWIISWDGTEGEVLNSIDSDGNSDIQISSRGIFRLADIEGDGIWEIQGQAFPENSEDSLQVNEENGFVLRTYSWNGSFYGKWPNTPQPSEDSTYPRNNIEMEVNAFVLYSNDSLVYSYYIQNFLSSSMDINELALKMDEDFSDHLNLRKCWRNKYRADSTAMVLWAYSIDCYNFINVGKSDTVLRLKLPNDYLPTISRLYVSGWNTDNYNFNDIFINSVNTQTIVPIHINSPFIPINFLDTLINYNQRSYELGWINNQSTTEKYDSLFTRAKTLLQGGHIPWVDSTLHTVLSDVDEDSSGNITSEAYALLKYNTEYLLEHLPEVTRPIINSISPPLALPYYARPLEVNVLTITVTGEFFTDSTVAYYRGNAKSTTFVSDSVVTFTLNSNEFADTGSYPIWVSNYGSVSDTMYLSVVNSTQEPIIPTLQCIHFNQDKTITAYFGYDNQNSVPVGIVSHSNYNYFSPGDGYRGQPDVFQPGIHTNVFSIIFDGTNLTWNLIDRSVTANKNSTPCPGE
ncbi:MAG TPA: hypothetical protein VLB50_05090 [Ignavibacteriaceae bacterium]|nr:hypothetical protein [Ignavibacteriaceae bacterium]